MQETLMSNNMLWEITAHGSFKILDNKAGIKRILLDIPNCKNIAQVEKAIELLIEAGIVQGGMVKIQRDFPS